MSAQPAQWGFMMLRFCEQGRTAHLLKPDGSPACGASFYASAGAAMDEPVTPKCGRCLRITNARKKP
jgi:hypothetical protein